MLFINPRKFSDQALADGVKFLTRVEADKQIEETGLITIGTFDDVAGIFAPNGKRWMFLASNIAYGQGQFPNGMDVKIQTWRMPYLRHHEIVAKDLDDIKRTYHITDVIESEAELIAIINMQVAALDTQHRISELGYKRPPLAQAVIDQDFSGILKDMSVHERNMSLAVWEISRNCHKGRLDTLMPLALQDEEFRKGFVALLGTVQRDTHGTWQVTRREHTQFISERQEALSSHELSVGYRYADSHQNSRVLIDFDAQLDGAGFRLSRDPTREEPTEMVVGAMIRMNMRFTDPVFSRHAVESFHHYALSRQNAEYLISNAYRLMAKHFPSTQA